MRKLISCIIRRVQIPVAAAVHFVIELVSCAEKQIAAERSLDGNHRETNIWICEIGVRHAKRRRDIAYPSRDERIRIRRVFHERLILMLPIVTELRFPQVQDIAVVEESASSAD